MSGHQRDCKVDFRGSAGGCRLRAGFRGGRTPRSQLAEEGRPWLCPLWDPQGPPRRFRSRRWRRSRLRSGFGPPLRAVSEAARRTERRPAAPPPHAPAATSSGLCLALESRRTSLKVPSRGNAEVAAKRTRHEMIVSEHDSIKKWDEPTHLANLGANERLDAVVLCWIFTSQVNLKRNKRA